MLTYFRQKKNPLVKYSIHFLQFLAVGAQVLFSLLFLQLIEETRTSATLRNLGNDFKIGLFTILVFQFIMIVMILGIIIWGSCSATYYLEKEIYL